MLEAEIRTSEVRSDMELLEEDCRQGSTYEFNQASSIKAGRGKQCMTQVAPYKPGSMGHAVAEENALIHSDWQYLCG